MTIEQPSIAAQVAHLPQLSMADLWTLWDQYFPRRPNKTGRDYLQSRLAYKIQEAAYGGLAPKTRQKLIQIGRQYSKIKTRDKPRDVLLAPGTTLVREWAAREHRVLVTAEGRFEYEGIGFKSLSAVARHITGTPWNGPAFFGLRKTGGAA